MHPSQLSAILAATGGGSGGSSIEDRNQTIPEYEKARVAKDAYRFEPRHPWEHEWYKDQLGTATSPYRNARADETPATARTLGQIVEARTGYTDKLGEINQAIIDAQSGTEHPRNRAGHVIISGATEDGRFIFDPTYMAGLKKAHKEFSPRGGSPQLSNVQVPALGEEGILSNEFGTKPYTAYRRELDDIGSRFYDAPLRVAKPDMASFSNVNPESEEFDDLYSTTFDDHGLWPDWEEAPDWWLNTTDRFGNRPLAEQRRNHNFLEILSGRKPWYRENDYDPNNPKDVQRLLSNRAAPPMQGGKGGMVPVPDWMTGPQAEKWINYVGQNWSGPTLGPEGSGNLIMNMINTDDWRGNPVP